MLTEIAPDVAAVTLLVSNTYLVGRSNSWALIDTGTPGSADTIQEAAKTRFGPGAKPLAILLTHGHFDHAGSAPELANRWDVPVYATRLEFPYLTGRTAYPPLDTSTPGAFSKIAVFFPSTTANVSARLKELSRDLSGYGMADWELIDTPGHTPGHVSFFRRRDGVLIGGDACTTMDIDSVLGILTKARKVCRPPAVGTTDWEAAERSVKTLAALKPRVLAAGHGEPMSDAGGELQQLADNFPVPKHGRYVSMPVRADENGITFLPPPAPRKVPKAAIGIAAGAIAVGAGVFVLIKKKSSLPGNASVR